MSARRPAPAGSFLVADCGHTTTTVALFDRVAGRQRLIATASNPTTAGAPAFDLAAGIKQAIRRLEEITGRALLTPSGDVLSPVQPSGSGVDYFGLTISAAPPLRAVIAGLVEDASVASARRALGTIYATEIDSLTLADTRDEEAQINALLSEQPDIIILTGGTDDGEGSRLLRILDTVDLALGLREGGKGPTVVYAGNRALREQVTAALGNQTTTHVTANVRPTLSIEQLGELSDLLGDLYQELKLDDVPGIDAVASWQSYPAQPSARALGQMIRYFGALYRGRVLGLDVGSDSVTIATADGDTLQLAVRTQLGMGQPLSRLLDGEAGQDVLSWLPVAMKEDALRDFVHTKALYPGTIPMSDEELQLEQALARYVMARAMSEAAATWAWPQAGGGAPPFSLLLLRGQALTQNARSGQALLMALDALQPTGVFSVALDQYGVLPALGLLAEHEPLTVVQVLEGGVLLDLGWVIAPRGRTSGRQSPLRVKVDAEKQGHLNVEVEPGELMLLPLAPGEKARLALEPARGVDVGFGPGQGKKLAIHGGVLGLVIDARGRPLALPKDDEARRETLRRWRWDMGG